MDMSDSPMAAVILAVGDQMTGQDDALKFPDSNKIHYAAFAEVTAARLAALSPAIVVSPLMCHSFDCLDLATRLQELGYRGKYRVLAPNVTRPKMIRAEIAAQAPQVDVEILTTGHQEPRCVT